MNREATKFNERVAKDYWEEVEMEMEEHKNWDEEVDFWDEEDIADFVNDMDNEKWARKPLP